MCVCTDGRRPKIYLASVTLRINERFKISLKRLHLLGFPSEMFLECNKQRKHRIHYGKSLEEQKCPQNHCFQWHEPWSRVTSCFSLPTWSSRLLVLTKLPNNWNHDEGNIASVYLLEKCFKRFKIMKRFSCIWIKYEYLPSGPRSISSMWHDKGWCQPVVLIWSGFRDPPSPPADQL